MSNYDCKGCPYYSHFTVLSSYYKRTIKDKIIRFIINKRGNSKFIIRDLKMFPSKVKVVQKLQLLFEDYQK